MKNGFIRTMVGLLVIALLCAGCQPGNPSAGTENTTTAPPTTEEKHAPDPAPGPGGYAQQLSEFGVNLLKGTAEPGRNTMISPLSAAFALSMVGSGARGETLAEMEAVLGVPVEELATYLSACEYDGTEDAILHSANAIWLNENAQLTLHPEFLRHCSDAFDAEAFTTPFDQAALEDINGWVSDNTDHMIPAMLDEISPSALMYLVNALSMDARWAQVYEPHQVQGGVFTTAKGETQPVWYLSSEEVYLQGENARGFLKYYEGERYAFAAVLPDEGISLDRYLASLDGQQLQQLLTPQGEARVLLPKFHSEFGEDLAGALMDMGMEKAFQHLQADFSGIGSSEDGNLFITQVLHKTAITVDEEGTEAAGSTAVIIAPGDAPQTKPILHLDRPFFYMIVDMQTGVPIFMGTLETVAE